MMSQDQSSTRHHRNSSGCSLGRASSIDAKRNLTERGAEQAMDCLGLYRIAAKHYALATQADSAEIILADVASLEVGLLVMGAYGRHGGREYLLGSCTKRPRWNARRSCSCITEAGPSPVQTSLRSNDSTIGREICDGAGSGRRSHRCRHARA